MILIIDFGSQTAHLISRRVRELGIDALITTPDMAMEIVSGKPEGIIFSGGPASVYAEGAPSVDADIFTLGIPILAICYGQQLTAHLLGGSVELGEVKEYGPATLKINRECALFTGVPPRSQIWMSHGDKVVTPPPGFSFVAQTESIHSAAMVDETRKIYGIQFHPEVEHTEYGTLILKNFLTNVCNLEIREMVFQPSDFISEYRLEIGNASAIAAVSGGLDSTVASTLVARAIGNRLIPVHVESGLMREGTTEMVVRYFRDALNLDVVVLRKQQEFLRVLKGITDPEQKRKIIGKLYVDLFEKELRGHKNVKYLVQGTIYSDVIESAGSKHADSIKSHHNVGGLPEEMKLQLIEPIRHLYTDQVRTLASSMKLPDSFISQQPHPGPGYAIRIMGEVTLPRLLMMQKADRIVIEEMKHFGWYDKVLHSFPVLTGVRSTSVKGDGRVYGEVVALRIVTSKDRMTADWAKIPYDILQKISSRLTNEIADVSRVVYDITTKPPATMEWE